MKKNKKLIIISLVSFTLLFVLFILLLKDRNNIENQTVDNWYNNVTSNNMVVTVIGSSTCPHCQEYKPIINAISKRYNFKLYFFEVDSLTEDDSTKLFNTYELENFDDHVPYTFIVNNNQFISDKIGFSNREDLLEYLKSNGVIKD